jgi:peptide chain release factor
MSKFGVSQAKERALEARLQALQIHEEDLEETFIRSSGPGGQHVNKTSTCVRLLHRPSGLSVKVQQSRSQGLNRFLARRLLADHVEQQLHGAESCQDQQRDKIRRQKQRRARRTRQKRREKTGNKSKGDNWAGLVNDDTPLKTRGRRGAYG